MLTQGHKNAKNKPQARLQKVRTKKSYETHKIRNITQIKNAKLCGKDEARRVKSTQEFSYLNDCVADMPETKYLPT